jgi:hypothetical protein
MNLAMRLLVVACIAGAALQASANPPPRSSSSKRQLIECMTRMMSTDRMLSYNQATKLCKERLQQQSDPMLAKEATKASGLR